MAAAPKDDDPDKADARKDAKAAAQAAPEEAAQPAPSGGPVDMFPQDEDSVKARALASGAALGSDGDQVRVRAKGMFHREANFQGPLVSHGEEFSTSKARAVELRASGLIEYCDNKLEDDAKQDEPAPPMDGGQPVITSRSVRPPRRTA